MDTTYIKMCDCPEVQEGHEWDEGDVFVAVGEPSVFGGMSDNVYVVGDTSAPHRRKGMWWSDCLISEAGDFHFKDCIWLPRQDQLQEMFDNRFSNRYKCIQAEKFTLYCKGLKAPEKFDLSMEQLWLAFVMKEKHSKTWTDNGWS